MYGAGEGLLGYGYALASPGEWEDYLSFPVWREIFPVICIIQRLLDFLSGDQRVRISLGDMKNPYLDINRCNTFFFFSRRMGEGLVNYCFASFPRHSPIPTVSVGNLRLIRL